MISFLLALAVAGATELPPAAPAVALPIPEEAGSGAIKMAFRFQGEDDFQMALTADSVGLLPMETGVGALEPDDEGDGIEHAVARRALSASEKDSASQLFELVARSFKGEKRFACPREDGYGFSLWSDSLILHCRNCFSCTDGIAMREAKILARLGRLSLWVYRMRGGMHP